MKAEAGNEAVNTTSLGSHGKSLHLIIHKVSEKSTCKEPAVAKGVHGELKKGRRLHIQRCKYWLSCYISLPVCMSYVESCLIIIRQFAPLATKWCGARTPWAG